MSDIESANYSETAGGNNAASPNGAPEGMAPSGVNDTIREIMAAIKRDWNRSHPTVTSGGAANAQTLTYATAPAGYFQGQRFCFIAGFTNTGAATLNVNGIGAKNISWLAAPRCSAARSWQASGRGRLRRDAVPDHGAAGPLPRRPDRHPDLRHRRHVHLHPHGGDEFVVVELVGAGGGGGGCATTGGAQVAMGAAAGAGGYGWKRVTASFSGVTVTVGAKGAGGNAGANNGTAGGSSSFGALLSATGGALGIGGTAQGAPAAVFGGVGGIGSSGSPNATGGDGVASIAPSVTSVVGGAGGSSFFGAGGRGASTTSGSVGGAA